MKRTSVFLLLVLGSAAAVCAQNNGAVAASNDIATSGPSQGATESKLSASASPASLHLFGATDSVNASDASPNTALHGDLAAPAAATPAAPAPAKPKFIYGGRDDYRWQLALGVSVFRFRSSIFTATAVGTSTSLAYFTNEWFAIEGNLSTGFAPQIFDREHVKLVTFTGGPKIAWRQRRWEPWAHALFGGIHAQPQTAGNSKTGYDMQFGGGADWRVYPRLSFRFEADYVRTGLFKQSQNNGAASASLVFHF